MDWYIVVKTINGRRYRYRQKTWREGGRVRTRSEYIGPADGLARTKKSADLTGATTLPLPFPPHPTTFDARHVDAALKMLMDTNVPSVSWRTPWDASYSGKLLVERQENIESLIARLELNRTYEQRGAYYSPAADIVNMPPMGMFTDEPFESATYAYYSTLLHELVHWTKGLSRTGRTQPVGNTGYAREELVAELGATILMQHFGLVPGDLRMHADYFQCWLRRSGSKNAALKHARMHAERAVRFILERGIINP
jgi:hypothetical protein